MEIKVLDFLVHYAYSWIRKPSNSHSIFNTLRRGTWVWNILSKLLANNPILRQISVSTKCNPHNFPQYVSYVHGTYVTMYVVQKFYRALFFRIKLFSFTIQTNILQQLTLPTKREMKKRDSSFWLVFGRCTVWISAATLTTLTEVWVVVLSPSYLKLCQDSSLPHPLYFLIR
jgi:hypothetical protein